MNALEKSNRNLSKRHAVPDRLRGLLSLGAVSNADDQLLRSADLTLSERHLARKRLTGGSESQPDGSPHGIATLKAGMTPVVHSRSVSWMETRR